MRRQIWCDVERCWEQRIDIDMLLQLDLYNDLEELQGMTRLLIDDVIRLRPKIGEGNPDPSDDENAYRRFYVRAVFALVEAFVEQHRRLVVHLCEAGKIHLRENKLRQLRETRKIFDSDGAVVGEEPNYMRIFDKIKQVYKAAAAGFGSRLRITFGDDHWREFKAAMEIRNQITHPKTIQDCWIFEASLQLVVAANEWFKALQNDFVRMAREHRERSRGLPCAW
jgi:hypothetical protein